MSNIEEDFLLFKKLRETPTRNCIDLSKNMIGKRNGFIYFTEQFRIDFENKMSDRERLIKENEELRYRMALDYRTRGEYIKAKSIILNHETEFISKDKIREIIRERQFELQQEYKDFKDDFILNELQDLVEDK